MTVDLVSLKAYQVFLNYPYDPDFRPFAEALSFAVVAAGLIPVTGLELSTPDTNRLELIVSAVKNCEYSVHDLSRCRGEGTENLARMNMPIEMGMALFHALSSQRHEHRCAFFVLKNDSLHTFASDLSGLDPFWYEKDTKNLVVATYSWLSKVGPKGIVSKQPPVQVTKAYNDFVAILGRIDGADPDGTPSHEEAREVMYQVCTDRGWWDFRANKAGKERFPEVPLSFRLPSDQQPTISPTIAND
jgi:hypothetical protein